MTDKSEHFDEAKENEMKFIWRFLRLFGVRRWKRLQLSYCTYTQADAELRRDLRWRVAKEEDTNHTPGMVWIEQVEEIVP